MNSMYKGLPFDTKIEISRLTLGANILPQKVLDTICPGCPFKTGLCEWHMKLAIKNEGMRASCRGTRAWIIQRN